jgi:hypothetical protein
MAINGGGDKKVWRVSGKEGLACRMHKGRGISGGMEE